MTRMDDIDLVDVPDQWDEIVQRAAASPVVDLAPVRRRGRRALQVAAVAASVLVVAGAATLVFNRDDSTTQVATTDPSVDDTTSPTTPAPVDEGDAAPLLACTGGELLAGSIPDDAVLGGDPLFDVEPFQEFRPSVSWSWRVEDLDVQLVVPGIPWVDFVGERTETLVDPPGTLAYMWDESGERATANAIVETGLPEPCARAEVIVAGGTEAERVAAATEAARSLSWSSVGDADNLDLSDVDDVRRWAVLTASAQVASGGAAEVVVYEWRVGDDVPWAWTQAETAGPGAVRYTVVITSVSGLEFQSYRGPGGSAPVSGSVITTVYGEGNGMYSLGRDPTLPSNLEPVQGPIPVLFSMNPAESHERMLELQQELERREQERIAQEEREQAEERRRQERGG